jgi:glucose/arabinose dehydrogenase
MEAKSLFRLRPEVCLFLAMMFCAPLAVRAATLPGGFSESPVASGLASPTAMQFAPDGRLFVAEQGGRLRVIKDGSLLPTPFLTVSVNAEGERGLLGVAFDPSFITNRYVYVYYTATSPNLHNRISRFTANGDVAAAGSEVVLFDLAQLSSATNHNGGALAFGHDGKLYAAVGENANGNNAQSMTTVLGKILRLNSDGSIPGDNPFYSSTSGNNRAIWALGLRNPFTFAFNPQGTDMFINDVGELTTEEINDGRAGANYGWPNTEGPTTDSRYVSPRSSYSHSGGACAITGGAFYAPLTAQFPSDYVNDYFFADFCGGWIRKLDPAAGNSVVGFATGITAPVDLKVSDDGSLYYLARGSGTSTGVVMRVSRTNNAPVISNSPTSKTVAPGASVAFGVTVSGTAPLRYQWQRNQVNIAGATGSQYNIASVATSDSGAKFRVIVSNDSGSATSNEATLTVTGNQVPLGQITAPATGAVYSGSDVINYAGTATDPEDGTLPASAFTWWIDFHHDTHVHPFMQPTSGSRGGSFTAPTVGHTAANVWYRIYLTVKDSSGATQTSQRDVLPRVSKLTLATNPPGLQLRLDDQPTASPVVTDSVVGVERTIEAVTPQTIGGVSYTFTGWSDGGAAAHTLSTPAADATYTATFTAGGGVAPGSGLTGTYFAEPNFTGASVTRLDASINFSWGVNGPMAGIPADNFSVRWTGQLEAPSTETYTFFAQSDDGVRVYINGQRIIDNWTIRATTENSGSIALVSGRRYDIVVEYFDYCCEANARLSWSSPSTAKVVVPTARLYPQAGYLGDRAFTSATNGWGPVERDRSNGETPPLDGRPLTIRGAAFTKGLGVHAPSDVGFTLPAACSQFQATIGLDDETNGRGSVVFEVWAGGVKLYNSATLTGTSPAVDVAVPLTGQTDLRLIVTDAGGSKDFDHADWAMARVTCP